MGDYIACRQPASSLHGRAGKCTVVRHVALPVDYRLLGGVNNASVQGLVVRNICIRAARGPVVLLKQETSKLGRVFRKVAAQNLGKSQVRSGRRKIKIQISWFPQ